MNKLWREFSKTCSYIMSRNGTWAAGSLMALGITASALPDTLFLKRRRQVVAYVDEDDKEKEIGKDLQTEIDKVLFKFNLKAEDEANLDLFLSSTSDPAHYGSLKMRMGAIIGLPASLEYKNKDGLERQSLTFQGISLNNEGDSSESLANLKSSLLLSDPSKHFLIAREVNYANSYHIHFLIGVKIVLGVSTYTSYYLLDNKLQAATRRLKGWVKGAALIAMSLLALLLYLPIKDTYNCWLDQSVDKAVAGLGKDYAEGGVDYYNSILLRNKSLRTLSKSGSRIFTPFGNETSTLRSKHLQLTTRRDNMVKLLTDYNKQVTENNNDITKINIDIIENNKGVNI